MIRRKYRGSDTALKLDCFFKLMIVLAQIEFKQ
jgi:hypothetical protein